MRPMNTSNQLGRLLLQPMLLRDDLRSQKRQADWTACLPEWIPSSSQYAHCLAVVPLPS